MPAEFRLGFGVRAGLISVIIRTRGAPANSRASHAGTRRGGLAPSICASAGSHSRTGAGSSSTML